IGKLLSNPKRLSLISTLRHTLLVATGLQSGYGLRAKSPNLFREVYSCRAFTSSPAHKSELENA
ncbi:hypothetical protein PIB30_065543, partial [Stylosanthes scabra]|nr:hypothetical protein [Stylosanthes scabra]